MLDRRRWLPAGVLAALLIAVTSCSSSQPGSAELVGSDPPPVKGLFDVAGRSLYLECVGAGTPTIVMDSGLGNDHTTWAKVVAGVQASSRTCTYDRANIGASAAAPTPRTSADVIADLHGLLVAAIVSPPFVLVGHSFGGISMQLYASTYPGEVVGLVLVDSTPITFVDDECAIVDATLCETLRAGWAASENPDGLDLEGSGRAIRAAGPLPAVPLVVLAATGHGQEAITDPGFEQRIEDAWQRRQQELAARTPTGRLEVVSTGHNIQLLKPQAVIDAIQSVLATLQPARSSEARS